MIFISTKKKPDIYYRGHLLPRSRYIYFIVVLIKYYCGGAMRRIAAHCAAMQQNFFEYMFSDSQTTSSWIEKLTQLDLCSKYVTLSNCAYPQKISLKTDDLNVICMKKRFWAHCAAMLQNLIFLMRRIAAHCAVLRRITSFTPKSHKSRCKQFYTMKYVEYWNMAKYTLRHLGSLYYFPEIKKIFFQFFIDFKPHSHI